MCFAAWCFLSWARGNRSLRLVLRRPLLPLSPMHQSLRHEEPTVDLNKINSTSDLLGRKRKVFCFCSLPPSSVYLTNKKIFAFSSFPD
jgi:hypothetical protein